VMEFISSLVEARTKGGVEAEPHWQHAIDMYRGHYLHGHDDPWIVTRRADFLEGYLEALAALASIRDEQGKPENALSLLLRALNDAYNREDLHRGVLRLYGKLGRRAEAADHYQKLEHEFREKYSIEPAPETQTVYRQAVGS
jgi:two-component system, LytTR family, response regulator